MTETNTHGVVINYGKHKGEFFTRLPVSYIRWMINEKAPGWEIAKAEFERRGDTMPKVELTGHAIDNASSKAGKIRLPDSNLSIRACNHGGEEWLDSVSRGRVMPIEQYRCQSAMAR